MTQSDRLSVGRVSERANMRKRALPHASICCIRLNWLELIHTKWAGCAESTAPYVNHGRTCVSQVNGEAHRTKMAVSGVRVRADVADSCTDCVKQTEDPTDVKPGNNDAVNMFKQVRAAAADGGLLHSRVRRICEATVSA